MGIQGAAPGPPSAGVGWPRDGFRVQGSVHVQSGSPLSRCQLCSRVWRCYLLIHSALVFCRLCVFSELLTAEQQIGPARKGATLKAIGK